ncbi:MAG TPA: nicotinate-nucleotide diphosphorylase (carboxylating), partial [Acidobacteriota bacterium]|nr:nicotinate-nucleotide diphosphorylase (carboxylating) [Acidobacteriota bacterium]
IEVETPSMLRNAIESGARRFLLDNMSPEQIKECVKLKKVGMFYEVSGGIGEKNFSDYLIPGVDAISIGGLTHSVESTDISMEID